jgi:flagellar protein FlaG
MISAITGLPDLVIDKQNDVQVEIEQNRRFVTERKNLQNESSKESTNQKPDIKEKKFNQEAIDELNKDLNSILEGNKLNVEFKFEKEANQLVMKIIDDETKEVVRQVPSDIMLKIARIISNQTGSGALADAKV